MPGSIRLGKIAGIDIAVHWSWLAIFVLLTWSLAVGYFAEFFEEWTRAERWTAAVATSLLFFGSVLLHELSHSLLAVRRGIPVRNITLFIFGGVSQLEREPDNPKDELAIALVGPATSFALGVLFAILWAIFVGSSGPAAAVAGYLAFINVALAVFNMLPGFPLDGGRVLRAILWFRNRNLLMATRVASVSGTFLAYALMLGGVLSIFATGNFIGGAWFIFIGWFLKNASEMSYRQLLLRTVLSGVSVSTLTQHACVSVPPNMSLAELVDEHVLRKNQRCFLVMVNEGLLGLITMTDIQRVPRDDWASTSVDKAMTPRERLMVVSPSDGLLDALKTMSEHDLHQLPVLRNGRVEGVLTRADIIRYLQTQAELQDEGARAHPRPTTP